MEYKSIFRNRKTFRIGLLIGIAATFIGSVSGDCINTNWGATEPTCPDTHKEMFLERSRETKRYIKHCCDYGRAEWKLYKDHYSGCTLTECKSSSSQNMCNDKNERYMDGKLIFYDQVMRDNCTKPDGSGKGEMAYCCPNDSVDRELAAIWGAEKNEFPHQVRLVLDGSQCGGTIYNKNWIITAAHCIVGKEDFKLKDASKMTAMAGSNFAGVEGDQYIYKVKRAISHEEYSKLEGAPELKKDKSQQQIYHDIALLELERPIQFSAAVNSLEIAPKGFDPFKYADKAVAVGWGKTITLSSSGFLQKVNFILRSDDTCFAHTAEAAYGWLNEYKDQMLCVGGIRDGTWSPTAGQGDSGGPTICRGEDGKILLCGVTSFGMDDKDCRDFNDEANCRPSVYADVGFYHDWIKTTTKEEQDPTTFYKPYLYGKIVGADDYKHQVHITSDTGRSCGGTLVAPDVVVTAARCVMRTDGSGTSHLGLKVHYGKRDVGGGSIRTFEIASLSPRPKFPKSESAEADTQSQGMRVKYTDKYLPEDLAIVKLKESVPIGKNDLPQLPMENDVFWEGQELAFPRNTTFGGEMRLRDFTILEKNDCKDRLKWFPKLGEDFKLSGNLLCGVEKYSGGSTCDRELGGGLICKKGGKDVFCGVQVFRLCDYTLPNAFLDVGKYAGWIKGAL